MSFSYLQIPEESVDILNLAGQEIRSIMRKMNIEIVELAENYGNTKFCGADLLAAQDAFLKDYCRQNTTDKVVCYCMSCLDGINRGGKQALHLVELLFPENEP